MTLRRPAPPAPGARGPQGRSCPLRPMPMPAATLPAGPGPPGGPCPGPAWAPQPLGAHPDSRVPPQPGSRAPQLPPRFLRYSGFGACPGPGSSRLPPQGPRSAHNPPGAQRHLHCTGPGNAGAAPAPPPGFMAIASPARRLCHLPRALLPAGNLPPRASRRPSGGGCGGAEHAQWRRRGCGCPHLPPRSGLRHVTPSQQRRARLLGLFFSPIVPAPRNGLRWPHEPGLRALTKPAVKP